MGKRILVILPSTTYRAGMFVEAARRLGVELIIGTDHQQAWGELLSGTVVVFPFYDFAIARQKVASLHEEKPLDAIIGVDDHTAWLAAHLSEHLRLPSNPETATQHTRFKHLMRQVLLRNGVLQPRYTLFNVDDNPRIIADIITYPVVLKPVFLSASQGVTRVDGPEDFEPAFQRIRALVHRRDYPRRGGRYYKYLLVEQYIDGEEVAVEGIITNGEARILAVFDKPDPLVGPYFQETIYVTPSRHPAATLQFIQDETRRAVRALGLQRGPFHAELRINHRGVWVIEVASRSIGGLCSQVLRFSDGQSLEEVLIREALGDDVSAVKREEQAAGVMMMPVLRSGRLLQVRGTEAARMVPGVESVHITIAPDSDVLALPEGNQYLGFIFARGKTPEAVEKALRTAYRFIHVEIDTGERVEHI